MKFILFIYGSIIGSFLVLMVERIITNREFVWSQSQCDNCKRTLSWIELIPIISYLLQHGKCKHCHQRIPPYLLIYEFNFGLAFSLYPQISIYQILLLICFLIISLFDLFTFKFSFWWLPVIFSLSYLNSNLNWKTIGYLFLGYLVTIFINKKLKVLGNGDLDLFFCLLISWGLVIMNYTILLASTTGLIYCLIKKSKAIPFIPFIAISLNLVLLLNSFF